MGFRWGGFLPPFSLLIPAFSLPPPPRVLAVTLRRRRDAPLPGASLRPRGFGSVLEPRVSSAQAVSTGELLRTLSMVAASEPTSRLSSMAYILSHLARHLGPWPAVRAVSLLSAGLITRALTPRAWRPWRSRFGWGRQALRPLARPVPYRHDAPLRLALKLFRGEPAISTLDWHFTPRRGSSQRFSTRTGSALRPVLLGFQPGHA